MPGALGGTAEAAHTLFGIHLSHAVYHMDGIVLTSLGAVAEAQAAELTDQGAAARHLGGRQAVVDALIGAPLSGLGAGTANQRHLPGHLLGLDTHDLRHFLRRGVAAGGAFPHRSLALQHRLGIGGAAGEAAAAAVGPGQSLDQLIQPGIGLYIKNPGRNGQHQAEKQAHAAQNQNCDQNWIHFPPLLRRSSGPRSP